MTTNYVTQPRTIEEPSCFRIGGNHTATDIAAGYILKHDGTNVDGVDKASAATDAIAGVSTELIEAGKSRSYQRSGKCWVYAGATVTKGSRAVADATGRAINASAATAATFVNHVGTFITAGDVGDKVELELELGPQGYVGLATVATRAALTAVAAANRFNGQLVLVQSDNSTWRFNSTSTTAADTAAELVLSPDAGTGKWIRADKAFVLKVPISKDSTDALAVETVPAGITLRLTGLPFWDMTLGWTGGSSSAIGISTSLTGYDTKGDLLGGASGDVAATLLDGIVLGTIGGEMDFTGFNEMLLVAGTEIRFDRITSAFTAGTGYVCIPVAVHLDA